MSVENQPKKNGGKHLIFTLHEEDYGVSLGDVKEVISMANNIRPVPQAPDYYKGLINLRGKIISIVDLRIKLAVKADAYQEKKTSIIITEFEGIMIGSIVDDVKKVKSIPATAIEPWRSESSKVDQNFITGVAKDDDGALTILLDMRKCLDIDEIITLHKANKAPQTDEIPDKKAA
ncbi:MAG: hypothetical protein A2504_14630 [Bdellovibrionales bacterium RIFOXYD12_FULL_39_22]|nr:MAG: hypothetical protein A2385_15110 [Bdellovibrionales bacterium RIFOXYB1_FULL_39_21]OFZ40538.1 MAG: hypothetical protein A2485_13560 [Bdellovibrionales bacterium RIFOXYC12_FULL_39_17]OFZ49546.1 MAG: hypothetical protein A2404_07845 [Bdellovibrionales bacterium RIFOXYC1_FULL_39_130]OFZ77150.1 MAG: hypothetical protein A2560_17875 [Bdellovibrionales bacterium RIFOXYD1_FULL_39_84]OFZ91426.1 MAG: hypothetical protein A2504_14630 [Bdellovibrionales bacterium RIFOXYD12_FULL_39_22]HLE09750.1 ch